jgi:hypothetical protein
MQTQGFYTDLLTNVVDKTQAAMNTPFQNFTGEKVAPLTANENQGIASAATNAGKYNPLLTAAGTTAQGQMSQNGPTSSELSGFMNPYTEYVLNNSLARLSEQSQANNVNIGSMAAMQGAFGGTRHGVLEGANMAEFLKSSGELSNKTYSDAFDKGMTNWNNSQSIKNQGVNNALNTSTSGQTVDANQLNDLMKTGATQRSIPQAQNDFNLAEFLRQQADPMQKAGFGSAAASAFPLAVFPTTGTVSNVNTPSTASQIVGGLATAASLYSAIGSGSTADPNGDYGHNAKGGLIKNYAVGGSVEGNSSARFGSDFNVNDYLSSIRDRMHMSLYGSRTQVPGPSGSPIDPNGTRAPSPTDTRLGRNRFNPDFMDRLSELFSQFGKSTHGGQDIRDAKTAEQNRTTADNAKILEQDALHQHSMLGSMGKAPFDMAALVRGATTSPSMEGDDPLGRYAGYSAFAGGGKVTQYSKDERDALTRLIQKQVFEKGQTIDYDFDQKPPVLRGSIGDVPLPRPKPTETVLHPSEERAYQIWKAKYAPRDSGQDYDLRGAFKDGLRPDPRTGHWPDTYKMPWHPTFSNQSKYYDIDPLAAGSWDGDRFVPPQHKFAKGGQIPKFSGKDGSTVLPNFTEPPEGDPLRDIEGAPTFRQDLNPENYDLGIDQLEAAHTRKVGDKYVPMDSFLSLNGHTQAFSLYQFLPGTWNGDIKKLSADDRKRLNIKPVSQAELLRYQQGDKELYDVLPSREAQRYVYHKVRLPTIAKALRDANLPVTPENVYYGHHFGEGAAPAVIKAFKDASPGAPMIEALREAGLKNFTPKDIEANGFNKPLRQYLDKVHNAFNNPGISPTTSTLNATDTQSRGPSNPSDWVDVLTSPGMQPKNYNTYEIKDALSRAKPYDADWAHWRSDVEKAQPADNTDPRYHRNRSFPTGEVDNRVSMPGVPFDRPPYHWHEGMPPATAADLFPPVRRRIMDNSNQDINYSGDENLSMSERADILTRKSRPEVQVSKERGEMMGRETDRTPQVGIEHFLNMFSPGFAKGGSIRKYAGQGDSVVMPIVQDDITMPIDQDKLAEMRDRARREWELKGILDNLAPGPGYVEPPEKTYSTPRPNMIDERDPLGALATPLTGKDRYLQAVDANRKQLGLKPLTDVSAKTWADSAQGAKDYSEGAYENGSRLVSAPWGSNDTYAGRAIEMPARMLASTIPLINEGAGQVLRGGMNVMSGLFDHIDDKAAPATGRKDLTANPAPLASPLDNYQYDAGDPFGVGNVLGAGDKLLDPNASPINTDDLTSNVVDDNHQQNQGADLYEQYIRDAKKRMDAADNEKQAPFLGMFGHVNKGLLNFGLTMLASPGNSFAEDLGLSGKASLDADQADLLQKQNMAAKRFDDAINARYKKALVDSLDPNKQMKIAKFKAEQDRLLEQYKAEITVAANDRKAIQEAHQHYRDELQKLYAAKGSDGYPSDAQQKEFTNFGLPELPPTPDMIEDTD